MSKNQRRYDIFDVSAHVVDKNNIREKKFEGDELKYKDAKKFRDCAKDEERFNLVIQASPNIPPLTKLSQAKEQINYFADQINRSIELKILYNIRLYNALL